MSLTDFSGFPLWANAALYVVAAAVVWWAGTRLTRHADTIARLTGLGAALVGMLLLGGITSLPEIAVSVTAGFAGSAGLAVGNLLGGVALQVVVIVIGDALVRHAAMTSAVPDATTLLQAVFSALLLAMVVAAVLVGDVAILGVGAWSTGVLVAGTAMLWLVSRYKGRERWRPDPEPEVGEAEGSGGDLSRSIRWTVGLGAVILVAGYVLARSGDALAGQTGLGGPFVGATLVAAATSLPEVSTVVEAVRLRRYNMAFSDIFGTNIFDLLLIFVIDAAYGGPAVLSEQGTFAAFGAVLGLAVTLVYAAGLIERRDRTGPAGLGFDSWTVLVVYLGGVACLWTLS